MQVSVDETDAHIARIHRWTKTQDQSTFCPIEKHRVGDFNAWRSLIVKMKN